MFQIVFAIVMSAMASSVIAADAGVSIDIGQPGYYGRIDIGTVSELPQVIYARPVYAQPASAGTNFQPLYLRVRPGYEKHWNNHCREYYACNRPVYFVREDWYQQQYAPRNRGEGSRGDKDRARVDDGRGEGKDRADDRRGEDGRNRSEDRRGEKAKGRYEAGGRGN